MSKGKRKSFSEQHKPNFAERLEAKNQMMYKKCGHINGRRYYRIVGKFDTDELFNEHRMHYYAVLPSAILTKLANVEITEGFRWLKPKQVTWLRLQGKTLYELDPWE